MGASVKNSAINSSKTCVHHPKTVDEGMSLALIEIAEGKDQVPSQNEPIDAPIVSSYNDHIRPLLDTIDRLRNLNVMKEGIQLPTIVMVGDQSSGKSSVLESLAGISLPRGQGICTRVPLVMRLQRHESSVPEILLEFNDKVVRTDEKHITEVISMATDEIAGSGKGVSDTPLTLHVRKNGAPDLTMVDLPGITRVPVHGQPENIYEQISGMIMKYIEPVESIILNVLSATVDFTTCESIRMSRKVDKTGKRTLGVVTKVDKVPEGLWEKVMADDVNIGLGYVCVRNRIGDETYQEARKQEALLFKTHPLLSMIDDDMVGIPVLAQKLMKIQATIITRCLPEIIRKISEKLDHNVVELKKLPKVISSTGDAMMTFMEIVGTAHQSLRKILVEGDFSEYPDDLNMHCTARLADKLNVFSDILGVGYRGKAPLSDSSDFMMDEIKVLEEGRCIGLPNFLPRSAFLAVLRDRMKVIESKPIEFVSDIWNYIEGVVLSVLGKHSENFPHIQFSIKRAGQNLISKMKERSLSRVMEMIETERHTDYTCNPEYMTHLSANIASVEYQLIQAVLKNEEKPDKVTLAGFGEVTVSHLRAYPDLLHQAIDLRMRITAYWEIVLRRIVDNVALHVQYSVKSLVDKELQKEIFEKVIHPGSDGGIQGMMVEPTAIAIKRERLKSSIELLKESKEAVSAVVDRVPLYGELLF